MFLFYPTIPTLRPPIIKLANLPTAIVALEATGGYERLILRGLTQAGIHTACVNPRRIKAFGRALNYLAKTDRQDAKLIAHYAQKIEPEAYQLPSEAQLKVSAWIKRKIQLREARTKEKQRLAKSQDTYIKADIKAEIKHLTKRIKKVDDLLMQLIATDEALKKQYSLLTSVTGIGPMTAQVLIALLPELGQLEHKKIAALCGVCPFNVDSGQFRGKRFIYGGRQLVRNYLYMAILASIRYNPAIRAFYKKLTEQGHKPSKVAMIACVSKLLRMLNAVIRDQKPWVSIAAETAEA